MPPRAEPLLAIDPGREKTGLAVVLPDGSSPLHEIVPAADLAAHVAALRERFGFTVVVLGDRTSSAEARSQLAALGGLAVVAVDEHRSTEEARSLYFRENPPRGLGRLFPAGLRTPPGPIDDYAAWILGLRYRAGR